MWETNLRKRRFILLPFPEGSVHGHLPTMHLGGTSWKWACAETESEGGTEDQL